MDNVNEFLESVDTLNQAGGWLSNQIAEFRKKLDVGSMTAEDKQRIAEFRGRAKSWVRDFQKLGIEDILSEQE